MNVLVKLDAGQGADLAGSTFSITADNGLVQPNTATMTQLLAGIAVVTEYSATKIYLTAVGGVCVGAVKTLNISGIIALTLSGESLIFGSGQSYQEVVINTSNPAYPAFSMTDNAGWITLSVYDGDTLISHPQLYASGMKIRVTVSSNAYGVARTGIVTITSGDRVSYILVSQIGGPAVVTPVVAGGEDWTLDPAYTVGILAAGSTQLTWSFRPIALGPGQTDIDVVITRGGTTVYSSSGVQFGRDGWTKTFPVTINEAAVAGETYVVTMSRT